MEEANKATFTQLCKSYDRLTADGRQVILMKVQPKIQQIVEQVRRQNAGKMNKKKGNQIQEVDLTNATGQVGNKRANQNSYQDSGSSTKRQNTGQIDQT